MLGSRKAGEKRHIRSMLNRFLMNWDGLASGMDSPFILLATNRSFDLDPAVLRRAPVRIQIDLPTQWEREQILKLLLEGETLAEGFELADIARATHMYTGSRDGNNIVRRRPAMGYRPEDPYGGPFS